jgi:hypothetical protein
MAKESVTYQATSTFNCLELCLFKIHFNIILPFTLKSSTWSPCSGFSYQSPVLFLFSAMHSMSAALLILHLVTLIMFSGYKLPYLSYPCRSELY